MARPHPLGLAYRLVVLRLRMSIAALGMHPRKDVRCKLLQLSLANSFPRRLNCQSVAGSLTSLNVTHLHGATTGCIHTTHLVQTTRHTSSSTTWRALFHNLVLSRKHPALSLLPHPGLSNDASPVPGVWWAEKSSHQPVPSLRLRHASRSLAETHDTPCNENGPPTPSADIH